MPDDNGIVEKEFFHEAAAEDRRESPRFPCSLTTSMHVLGPRGTNTWVAQVQDISTTGIGLRYKRSVKPGTVLVITLQSSNLKLSRPLPVRVMHATQKSDDDWLLGCSFVRRISQEDLMALL